MSTDYQNKILEALKDEKNYEELLNLTKLDKDKIRSPLAALLNKEMIKISGFSKADKFGLKSIKFKKRLSHKTTTDIMILINYLECNEVEKARESREELEIIFEKKFNDYEELENLHWKNLVDKTESMPIAEYIKFCERKLDEKSKLLKEIKISKKHRYTELKNHLINNLETCKLWHKYYKNAIVWILDAPDDTIKNQFSSTPPELSLGSIKYPTCEKNVIKNEFTPLTLQDIIKNKDRILIDISKSWNSETFLENKGFKKPIKLSKKEIKTIFSKILFFINSHENYHFMKNSLTVSLSDEDDSVEWFKLFIESTKNQTQILKQKIGSNIINDTDRINYYRNLGTQ